MIGIFDSDIMKARASLIIILFIITVSVLLVGPGKNFPLNDGWAHTITADSLVNKKIFFYPKWLSPVNYIPIITVTVII